MIPVGEGSDGGDVPRTAIPDASSFAGRYNLHNCSGLAV